MMQLQPAVAILARSAWPASRTDSGWLHALPFEYRHRARTRQELKQLAGHLRRNGICPPCAPPPDVRLDLVRDRSDKLNAGRGQYLRDDNQSKFNLAFRDEFRHDISIRPHDLRCDRVQNSQSLEQSVQVSAARSILLEIRDRSRVQ